MIGYGGCGRLTAFPLRIVDGTRRVVGGFTTGGSGALSGMTTVGVPEQFTQLPELPGNAAPGGLTLRLLIMKLGSVTGGMLTAAVLMVSGTFNGSLVVVWAIVRSCTRAVGSTGALDGVEC